MSLTITIATSLVPAFAKFLLKQYLNDDGVNTVADVLSDVGESKVKNALDQMQARQVMEGWSTLIIRDLISRLEDEQKKKPGVNIEAVATQLAETLKVDVSAEFFVKGDLDAKLVLHEYRTKRPLPRGILNLDEDLLYEQVLEAAVKSLVATAGCLPQFNEKAVAESLKRLRGLEETVEKVLDGNRRIELSVQRLVEDRDPQKFEIDYRQAIAANLDYIELFGVTIPREVRRFQLTEAFVTLNLQRQKSRAGEATQSPPQDDSANGSNENEPDSELLSCESLMERLRPGDGRLLIRGVAGSGKTTLMRWIAIQAATIEHQELVYLRTLGEIPTILVDAANAQNVPVSRILRARESSKTTGDFVMHMNVALQGVDEFYPNPVPWREQVPFIVPLRYCRDGKLPEAKDFPALIGEGPEKPPVNWVRDVLKTGRGLVLIDGVDEVPPDQREQVVGWIEQLTTHYPLSYFVVTTRPEAVPPDWLAHLNFREARVNPMAGTEIELFVNRWHQAAERSLNRSGKPTDLDNKCQHLLEQLEENDALKPLAMYPLLCGLICALHLESAGTLPETQSALCDAMCDALIHKREREQTEFDLAPFPASYRELTIDQKRTLIQDLAVYMVEEGRAALRQSEALERLKKRLAGFRDRKADDAPVVLQGLLERSGVLREPVPGEIDFLHNTFKEFLAGEYFASERSVRKLLDRALAVDPKVSDDWRRVLLFAVGSRHVPEGFLSDIISKLLHEPETDVPVSGQRRRSKKSVLTDPQRKRHLLALQCQFVADGKGVDPEMKDRLKNLVKDLFPPRTLSDAESLATLRNHAVAYLKRPAKEKQSEKLLANCVRALRLINTPLAQQELKDYRDLESDAALDELSQVFDPLTLPGVISRLLQDDYWKSRLSETIRHRITNLSALKSVPGLKGLSLRGSSVKDFSLLSELAQLEWLNLEGTTIENLSPLSVLKRLAWLSLAKTKITIISPLKDLTAMTVLDLSDTAVKDISPLKDLSALTALGLGRMADTDISPLRDLTALTVLDLSGTAITDISPLKGLTALRQLELSGTAITDFSPLKGLTALTGLYLNGSRVTDISPLKDLTALNVLYLSGTGVTDISPLKDLTALIGLYLDNTAVTDITPLKNLTALRELNLSGTAVRDISPLKELKNLTIIR